MDETNPLRHEMLRQAAELDALRIVVVVLMDALGRNGIMPASETEARRALANALLARVPERGGTHGDIHNTRVAATVREMLSLLQP